MVSWKKGQVSDSKTHQNKLAELEDLWELRAHGVLEMLGLHLCHTTRGKVKDFLWKQLQNSHIILAKRLIGLAGPNNVWDEAGPVLGPLSFKDQHQDHIQLWQVHFLSFSALRVWRGFDDEANNVLFYALTLLPGKCFPSSFDDSFKDLQCIVLGLLVRRELEDGVNPSPGLWVLFQCRQHIPRQFLLESNKHLSDGELRNQKKCLTCSPTPAYMHPTMLSSRVMSSFCSKSSSLDACSARLVILSSWVGSSLYNPINVKSKWWHWTKADTGGTKNLVLFGIQNWRVNRVTGGGGSECGW